jgi:hypothetical protein
VRAEPPRIWSLNRQLLKINGRRAGVKNCRSPQTPALQDRGWGRRQRRVPVRPERLPVKVASGRGDSARLACEAPDTAAARAGSAGGLAAAPGNVAALHLCIYGAALCRCITSLHLRRCTTSLPASHLTSLSILGTWVGGWARDATRRPSPGAACSVVIGAIGCDRAPPLPVEDGACSLPIVSYRAPFSVSCRAPFSVSCRAPFSVSCRAPFSVSCPAPFNVSYRVPFSVDGIGGRATGAVWFCATVACSVDADTPESSGSGSRNGW